MQAFASYIAVNLCVVDFTATDDVIKSALLGILTSALAAGIAAVMNLEKPELEDLEEDI